MEAAAAAATAAAIRAESERIQAQLEHEKAAAEAAALEVRKRKEMAEREYEAKRREQAEAAEREFERRRKDEALAARKEETARLQLHRESIASRSPGSIDDLGREADNDRLVFQSPSISSAFNNSLRNVDEVAGVLSSPTTTTTAASSSSSSSSSSSISQPTAEEVASRRRKADSMSMSQLSQETKKRLGLSATMGLADSINAACKIQGIKTTGNLKADALAAFVGQR
jgi:hypothetical protein